MLVYDAISRLVIADDQFDNLAFPTPDVHEVRNALSSMILSFSGWRKVFAASGDEEDNTPAITEADALLCALAALALARFLGVPAAQKDAFEKDFPIEQTKTTILVGLDARPTGREMGDIVSRVLTALGCKVRYLFICAAPEIMADCNLFPEEADAFLYISASHNPIGHNGFKFGRKGGVFNAEESGKLTNIFKSIVLEEEKTIEYVQRLSATVDTELYKAVLGNVKQEKEQSLDRYEQFVLETATKSTDRDGQLQFIKQIIASTQKKELGILGELNGSARGVSIDYLFLKSLGLKVTMLNNQIGEVVHAIVPEGENLSLCRQTLQQLYQKDRSYLLGYVPDNDGDRGNLVYMDQGTTMARTLEAQEVFALVVLVELCQTILMQPGAKVAVVVNAPTSMRIDQIAQVLGAEVFRSEVGEANVVELAEQKRSEGYVVPVLGEGSNGGNITHPAKVRDPMNTLMSLVKLLTNRDIAKLWFRALGQEVPTTITLELIIESLPKYITTGAFSADGKMAIQKNHQELKNRYESLFLSDWLDKSEMLSQMGIHGYRFEQTESTHCRIGMGEAFRSPPYSGGMKTVLLDEDGVATDFLWMRGSKTEPVFRVLADCKGVDEQRHDILLAWHRDLIKRSDS